MRLLVVDDSPTCQKVIARSLAHLEFTFLEASNGEEAIKILSEKPLRVDAVLMDLRMPVMDGLTAIRICRTELGLTALPIIALTAEVGSSIKAEAMKAGATWFLNKPAKSRELIGILRASSCGDV
jgi:CheY-like chemotaxis protein